MNNEIEQLLETHKLRKTEMRRQVLSVFINSGSKALSNADIEQSLENPDRITLYRTLRTFEKKGLIHRAVDSTDTTKYAYCQEDCSEHAHHDEHAHFHCYQCGKTICLEDIVLPEVKVPAGYTTRQMHLALEGTCDECTTES